MGWVDAIQNRLQYYSDQLKSQFRYRWMATFVLACFYAIRVYLNGCLVITVILGMTLTNLVIYLLTSIIDPDSPDRLSVPVSSNAPLILPIKASDELRPFQPVFPEFYFWRAVNIVLCVALCMTFIPYPTEPIFPERHWWFIFFGLWLSFTIIALNDQRNYISRNKYIPFYYGDKKRRRNSKVNSLLLVVERGWRVPWSIFQAYWDYLGICKINQRRD